MVLELVLEARRQIFRVEEEFLRVSLKHGVRTGP